MPAFLIADTFSDSLARLTGEEQTAVKTTAFDLQMDPTAPGLSFHRLDRAKDKRFWSVRVNADISCTAPTPACCCWGTGRSNRDGPSGGYSRERRSAWAFSSRGVCSRCRCCFD